MTTVTILFALAWFRFVLVIVSLACWWLGHREKARAVSAGMFNTGTYDNHNPDNLLPLGSPFFSFINEL